MDAVSLTVLHAMLHAMRIYTIWHESYIHIDYIPKIIKYWQVMCSPAAAVVGTTDDEFPIN